MGIGMFRPWRQALKFSGRIARRDYVLFYAQIMAVLVGLLAIAWALADRGQASMSAAVMSVLIAFSVYGFVATLSASVRRLHDHDRSGWLYLLTAIPLIGWIFFLIMMSAPGTEGENRYGPDPRDGKQVADEVGAVFS